VIKLRIERARSIVLSVDTLMGRRRQGYHHRHLFAVMSPCFSKVHAMHSSSTFSGWPFAPLRLGWGLVALLALAGCDWFGGATRDPGWYLEKTGDTTARVINVNSKGQREVWEGTLADDSPRAGILTPLRPDQDKGLFRWSYPGCTELSFVLSSQALKCTTCIEPAKLLPDSRCPIDQQRLPVEGWVGIKLPLPR